MQYPKQEMIVIGVRIGILGKNLKNNMDDEVFEKAKEEDMSKDEAEELQELMDETGLDVDEAHELWQEL